MATRIPSLNWLRVFEAAARSGSFARAAERLAMSPPAVSQQIRALEAHMGRALFDRQAAGVRLTEAGRSLLMVVGDALGRMETAAAALSGPARPNLVVGASLAFSMGWLTPRLPGFLHSHPTLNLDLRSLLGRDETPPREAVLWIGFGPPAPGTEAIRLFGERLIPVARPDLARAVQSLSDLRQHRLIEVRDHRRNWAQVLGTDVMPPEVRTISVDTTLTALSLAATGGGIALARPPATGDLLDRYALAPCLPGADIAGIDAYHLLHASGARLSAEEEAFKAWIAQEAQASRESFGM
ncbi:MAG: LysR family transcriptional regulator [Pseudomonadota bacterium]